MKKNRQLKYSLFLLIIAVLVSLSCQRSQFSLEQEAIRIPLIIANNRYFSYIVDNNGDSIRMLIDTGATRSRLLDTDAANTMRTSTVRDAGGFKRETPLRRVREMRWGGLKIENLLTLNDPLRRRNIIGGDILSNFIVQFDNGNREIILSQNPSAIEKKGIRVPFRRSRNHVILSLALNGKEGDFILDTGYRGELTVDSTFFYFFGLSGLEKAKWRGYLTSPIFMPDSLRGRCTARIALANGKLGDKIFENTIVTHYTNWRINVIGSAFLQRFSTFTIDYLNGYVYFELPEGIALLNDNVIETVPPAYINLLRNRINSLGIQFSHRADVSTVSSLLQDGTFARIEIGDTLVGINQTIFKEAAFNKLGTNTDDLFCLETNRFLQRRALNSAFLEDKATFHFLKNGELISIDRVRDRIVYPEPRLSHRNVSESETLMLQMIEDGRMVVDSVTISPDGGRVFHRPRIPTPLLLQVCEYENTP